MAQQPSELERIRRANARAALYVSLVLVTAVLALLVVWLRGAVSLERVADWSKVDYGSLPEVQLLQRYVAIDTSLPDGDPTAGADFVAGLLRAAGVEPTVERVGEKNVNLWAILEGADPAAIVLHHHIDVDPIRNAEHWVHPPFGGEIDGPWIYGRGTFDMKSVAVAQIEAFLRLARGGKRLSRSVILLATSGEETGSDLGMKWVLGRHPELVGRFWAVLTEGGAVEGRSPEEVKYWGTEVAQNRLIEAVVCSADRGRLEELRGELLASGRGYTALRVVPEVARFLASYAPTRDRSDLRQLLGDPQALVRDLSTFQSQPPYLQSMFRDEAVPFPVAEAEGGGFEMKIYLHLLPGADPERAVAELLPPWRLHGLGYTVHDEGGAGHGSPVEHPVMAAISDVIGERYPKVPVGPLFLPWTLTDSRFVRAAGVPSYGFSPFMVLTPEVMRIVQADTVNERIALPGFVEGVAIYSDVLARLTD